MNNQKTASAATRTINTIMLWLFCLTVLMLIMPWEIFSVSFARQVAENKMFIYFALIIEISNFITQFFVSLSSAVNHKKSVRELKERVVRSVECLDFSERALLREFVLQRKSVLTLPLSEPTVRNLIDCCVLRVVDTVDMETKKAEVIISKEARPYITYKAIGLTLGKMSEEQVSQIMNSRPEYAREKFTRPGRFSHGASSIKELYTANSEKAA